MTFSVNAITDFGCAGDGSDDTTKIQAAIDFLYANHSGGRVQMDATRFGIPGGIVLKGGVVLEGSTQTSTLLQVGTANPSRAIYLDATCNQAGLRDLSVYGGTVSGNTIHIENNVKYAIHRCNIFGGYNAIYNGGVDGILSDSTVSTPLNANIVSVGSNRYHNVISDVSGSIAPAYSFFQSQSWGGDVLSENHFTGGCDFTGAWRIAAIMIDDLGIHKSIITVSDGVLGGSVVMTSAMALLLSNCEVGPDIYNNDPNCFIGATNCFGSSRTCTIHGSASTVGIVGGSRIQRG